MPITLIGGGSRSGKSTYALVRAREIGQRLGFIATAEAHDEEMRERIARHREDRPADFHTIEEPLNLAEVLASCEGKFDAVVIDCLTLWLSNLMLAGCTDLENTFAQLMQVTRQSNFSVLFVTNEVGCGLVPDTEIGRRFRDAAGRLNQSVAAMASEVYWTVFGIPVRIK